MAGLLTRRWTGDDLDRMVAAGIVCEGSHAYLWNGAFIEPIAEDQPHLLALKNVRKLIEARFPEGDWSVNTCQSVDLREGFRPEPDVVVLRGPDSAFAGKGNRPGPAEVAILVEVSASTYAQDFGEYLREYARAGIESCWIVNIEARRVEVYTRPDRAGGGYGTAEQFGLEQAVPVVVDVGGRRHEFAAMAVRDAFRNVV